MNITLKSITAALLIAMGTSASGYAPESDMVFTMRGFMPRTRQDWERASGIEMQARFWGGANVGAAVSAGIDSWVANSEYIEEEDEFGYYSSYIYGDTTVIPMGISALLRGDVNKRTAFVFEAGFRYGFTDSRVNAETSYADAEESFYAVDRIETDNVVLGVLGLSMETEIVDGLRLRGGLRYQFDLVEPHEWFLGDDMGATSFQTASVDLGLAWTF